MNDKSETAAFWDKPDPARSTTARRRRRRFPMHRWATIGVAGTVGLGAVVGVAYAATGGSGSSGKPADHRPAAAGATTSPESVPIPDNPQPTKRKPHRKTHKPTPRPSHKKTHRPAPAKTQHAPPPVAGGPTGKAAQYAAQVLSITNSERAQHGCGALTINTKLARAAQGHSADMVARHFFDHTNPDGKGPGERLAAVGYPSAAWGENIAAGQQTPADVMGSWMNSPGHRANILNCGYHAIGIGVAFSSGTPYWTQDFGSDR